MSDLDSSAMDPRADVIKYRERLLADLYDLSLQLSVFLQLGQVDDRRFFWSAQAFFSAVDRALFSSLITLATRIVGKEDEGLRSFLKLAEDNLTLFPGVKPEHVQQDRSALEGSDDHKSLKVWRDKRIAHSDKAFYFDRTKVSDQAPDPISSLSGITELSFRILNRYSESFDGVVNCSVVGNAGDLRNLVRLVQKGYAALGNTEEVELGGP